MIVICPLRDWCHHACMARLADASSDAWNLGGASIRENGTKKKHTLNHLFGRDCICSMLLVTGRVIKHEEAFGRPACFALKDVDRTIGLIDKFFRVEIPVAVLPWFEHNAGLSKSIIRECNQ